jgi:hypothetical protein
MRTTITALTLMIPALAVGCWDQKPVGTCAVRFEYEETEMMVGCYAAVDILVVVDNTQNMGEAQTVLGAAFEPLVDGLAPSVDNVRIAVVSTDMGLQWGAPAQPPPDGVEFPGCGDYGDNGAFQQGAYAGDPQGCPALAATWAETTPETPNPDLAAQAACLTQLGTDGCGFEQQLAAAAASLMGNDHTFIRESALLAVLIVSDEEDCSMQDGPGLFGTAEFQDPRRTGIACGENPQFLFPAGSYYNTFRALKGGQANAVMFGAFVGVPYDPDVPGRDGVCQGRGNAIGACLDAPKMQQTIVEEDLPDGGSIETYAPACTRGPIDSPIVEAQPGRRYVELATANPPDGFGNMGYVSSICNPDWSLAMRDIAKLIASNLVGACYEKPLDWDPATKTAKCDVIAVFLLGEDKDVTATSCPWGGVKPTAEQKTDEVTGQEKTYVYCPLPKLPADLDCALARDEVSQSDLGWYYCEEASEASDDACRDGLDNDKDGLVDCKDPECQDCKIACGKDFPNATGKDCALSCKFNVRVTTAGKKAVKGKSLSIGCLKQVSDCDGGAS